MNTQEEKSQKKIIDLLKTHYGTSEIDSSGFEDFYQAIETGIEERTEFYQISRVIDSLESNYLARQQSHDAINRRLEKILTQTKDKEAKQSKNWWSRLLSKLLAMIGLCRS